MLVSSLKELNDLSLSLTKHCKPNTCFLLFGEMGSGKTTFSKMLLKNLGVEGVVNSPTFTIMNNYEVNNLKINHVDAYRLDNDSEIELYIEYFENAFSIVE
jgi:tRNA threonylcarbamoyladenosine biosynthesis protein TsaE